MKSIEIGSLSASEQIDSRTAKAEVVCQEPQVRADEYLKILNISIWKREVEVLARFHAR